MGWWEWAKEFAAGVTHRIETGLKEFLGQPEEIAPYLPTRPATEEQIDEAMEAAIYAERFLQEVEIDEARRLARGVPFYEKLTNVARLRHWTVADPFAGPPPKGAMWSIRACVVGPDGRLTYVDVRGKTGEVMNRDEFLRAAASSLEDDFVNSYKGVSRSAMIREWVVAMETYVERFKPLAGR